MTPHFSSNLQPADPKLTRLATVTHLHAATKQSRHQGERMTTQQAIRRVHSTGWDEMLAEFEDYQVASNLSEKTIANRQECLRQLAAKTGEDPWTVTRQDLLRHLGRRHHRTGLHLAQGTMQAERSYFQSFFGWMLDEGHRGDNPAARLPKVKMARRKPRPFRMDQVEAMLDSGAYRRTRDIITICALTGLRIGEVVRIRGEDVDLVGMVIRSRRKGGLEHRLPIKAGLFELVKRYPNSGWWFPSPYPNKQFPDGGGHILMASASDAISKAIRRAGITDESLTGHSLRHYLATTMLRNGVNIRVVQEMLGHASLATTQLYTDVDEEDMREGVNVVPDIPIRARSGRRGRIAA